MAEKSAFFYADLERLQREGRRQAPHRRCRRPAGRSGAAQLAALADWRPQPRCTAPSTVSPKRAGLGLGKVAQPIRVAVVGMAISPPVDQTLFLLGRDRTLARLKAAVSVHSIQVLSSIKREPESWQLKSPFPDGNKKSFDQARHRPRDRPGHFARPRQEGGAGQRQRRAVGPDPSDRPATPRISIITRDKPEALEIDPPRRRARARAGGAGAVSRHADHLRSGDRRRFLLRLRAREPFTEGDLEKIEAKMREIVKRDLPITREVWSHDAAIEAFRSGRREVQGRMDSRRHQAPTSELTIYQQGDKWLDMCLGPHLPSTGKLGSAFKLIQRRRRLLARRCQQRAAAAHLRRRFATDDELKAYLTQVEEAEKRDHRKLAEQLDLFHHAGRSAGHGVLASEGLGDLSRTLEQLRARRVDRKSRLCGSQAPADDGRSALWKKSGHWDNYRDEHVHSPKSEEVAQAHAGGQADELPRPRADLQRQGIHSYRDLPLRYRRVRRLPSQRALRRTARPRCACARSCRTTRIFFCTEEQIKSETGCVHRTACSAMYKDLGFTEVRVKFSDRPDQPRRCRRHLGPRRRRLARRRPTQAGLALTENPGEGAFYGPKLEFVLQATPSAAIGSAAPCRLDFVLPGRLDAEYVARGRGRRTASGDAASGGAWDRSSASSASLWKTDAGEVP